MGQGRVDVHILQRSNTNQTTNAAPHGPPFKHSGISGWDRGVNPPVSSSLPAASCSSWSPASPPLTIPPHPA